MQEAQFSYNWSFSTPKGINGIATKLFELCEGLSEEESFSTPKDINGIATQWFRNKSVSRPQVSVPRRALMELLPARIADALVEM